MGRLQLSSIFFALAGIFSLILVPVPQAEDTSGDEIRIGVIVDVTGPRAAQGQLKLKGMQDYFRYLNEVGSGIAGRKLALAIVDGGTSFRTVLQNVEKFFVAPGVHMSVVWNGNICEKLRPLFFEHEIPHLDFSRCPRALPPPPSYTYLPFGGTVLDVYATLEYIETVHGGSEPPKIGILTVDDACENLINSLNKTEAAENRFKIVAVIKFEPNIENPEPSLLKLKRMGAEYIFMQCAAADALATLRSADRIHYDVPFFIPWTTLNADSLNLLKGSARHPINISFPGCLPGDGTSGIHLIKALIDRYQSVSRFHTAYWEGVAAAAVVARALQKAHEILDVINGRKINLALETFQKEDFGKLIPDITYTDTNHSASFVTRIVRVNKNRTFTPLTKFWNPKSEKVTIVP
ncbi:conserved hypothetical protein [delta proteobacterium NaphS2]|nr:conserved hypothetical protein [delta proteobacterium NaphS2]